MSRDKNAKRVRDGKKRPLPPPPSKRAEALWGAAQTTPRADRVDFCTDHSREISSLFSTLPLVRQRIRWPNLSTRITYTLLCWQIVELSRWHYQSQEFGGISWISNILHILLALQSPSPDAVVSVYWLCRWFCVQSTLPMPLAPAARLIAKVPLLQHDEKHLLLNRATRTAKITAFHNFFLFLPTLQVDTRAHGFLWIRQILRFRNSPYWFDLICTNRLLPALCFLSNSCAENWPSQVHSTMAPPAIYGEPKINNKDGTVSLEVTATGADPKKTQWFYGDKELDENETVKFSNADEGGNRRKFVCEIRVRAEF